MEKKNTVFDFVGQIFMIFGFSISSLMIFVYIFGQDAKGYSTIFLLGKEGLSLSTLAQFLLTSTMINLFRQLFLGGQIIKNMSIPIRTVCLFSSIVIMMVAFILLFDWFPVDDWLAWVLFVISFGVSSVGGFVVSYLKEKGTNKRMEEALRRMQEGNE